MTAPGEILLVACYELGHQPLSVAWPAAFLERAGFGPAVMDLSVEPFDADKVRRARLVVDTYAGAFEEAGDVLIPIKEGAITRDHVTAELAEIVTGARRGRTRADEITVFKSVGWALEDLAAARLAYNRAVAQKIGIEVTL